MISVGGEDFDRANAAISSRKGLKDNTYSRLASDNFLDLESVGAFDEQGEGTHLAESDLSAAVSITEAALFVNFYS